MDGTQHKNLERERQNILGKIKALKFGWATVNQYGNPHSHVLNKIGHVENMMIHMGGRDQMNSREKNFYDLLQRSFKQSDRLEVPRESRPSQDLQYVSVHGLLNPDGPKILNVMKVANTFIEKLGSAGRTER